VWSFAGSFAGSFVVGYSWGGGVVVDRVAAAHALITEAHVLLAAAVGVVVRGREKGVGGGGGKSVVRVKKFQPEQLYVWGQDKYIIK